MLRGTIALLLVVILFAVAGWFLLQPVPQENLRIDIEPTGLSQRTVSGLSISSSDMLSPDRRKVWINARIGVPRASDVHVLIDLENNATLGVVYHAQQILGWDGSEEVLVARVAARDLNWRRVGRKLGMNFERVYITEIYRLSLATGVFSLVSEIPADSWMSQFCLSPDREWMVGTWGPRQCHEVNLKSGAVSTTISEPYVWSPRFVDDRTFMFVGETNLLERKVEGMESTRVSNPLLTEIRDAIQLRGRPTIGLCGLVGDKVLVVDHVLEGRHDRLLELDRQTRLLRDMALLEPSRSQPAFSPGGGQMVYQGHQFRRTRDWVFHQRVAKDSTPTLCIKGPTGQVNQASPVFLDEERILYVHRGNELRSFPLADLDAQTLHWPTALAP